MHPCKRFVINRGLTLSRLNYFLSALIFLLFLYCVIFYVLLQSWYFKSTSSEAVKLSENSGVSLSRVVVHLDLKGSPPKLAYVESLLPMLKSLGVTDLLVEYEDMFPYEGNLVNLSCDHHYDKHELTNFFTVADAVGLEIIPLIQTFGHLEFALKLHEFSHLRESQLYPDSICPSHSDTNDFLKELLKQIIELHNNVKQLKYIHVGCDEVFHINECDTCRRRRVSDVELFVNHLNELTKTLNHLTPGTRVLIWDDMLRTQTPYELTTLQIGDNIEPVVWDYTSAISIQHKTMYNYRKKFENIWIGTAFKGADGRVAAFPNIFERYFNHLSWLNFIDNYKFGNDVNSYEFKGIILTGWSRYSHMEAPCELLPVSIPSLFLSLLVIEGYKSGVILEDHENILNTSYTKEMEGLWKRTLKCDSKAKFEYFDGYCKFDGAQLYHALKQFLNVHYNVVKSLDGIGSDLANLPYYNKTGLINMNRLSDNIEWCNNSLQILKIHEANVVHAMEPFYEANVGDEYVNFRTFQVKNQIQALIKFMISFNRPRVWNRRGKE